MIVKAFWRRDVRGTSNMKLKFKYKDSTLARVTPMVRKEEMSPATEVPVRYAPDCPMHGSSRSREMGDV